MVKSQSLILTSKLFLLEMVVLKQFISAKHYMKKYYDKYCKAYKYSGSLLA